MTDHTKPAYFVDGGHRTRAEARKLAAMLLAFAGPERAEELSLMVPGGHYVTVKGSCADRRVIGVTVNGHYAHLRPEQIDQLITWLQGHREDNP